MATAYEEMVRVSSDRFVAPRLVTFDVAGADAALDNLVPGSGVMPLAEMDSFVTFPPVDGWPWNGYQLESYLRRESKDFKYLSDAEEVSSKKLFSDLSKNLDDDGEESTNARSRSAKATTSPSCSMNSTTRKERSSFRAPLFFRLSILFLLGYRCITFVLFFVSCR